MKPPRFRIAWVMVAVALAAVDFGVVRACLDRPGTPAGDLLILGALPMANVLIVGMLIARSLG